MKVRFVRWTMNNPKYQKGFGVLSLEAVGLVGESSSLREEKKTTVIDFLLPLLVSARRTERRRIRDDGEEP